MWSDNYKKLCVFGIVCLTLLTTNSDARAQMHHGVMGSGLVNYQREDIRPIERAAVRVDRETAQEERIEQILDQPVSIDFHDEHLHEVAAALAASVGVSIVLDKKGLTDAAVDPSAPVTFAATDISLRHALASMLDEFDLTFLPHNDLLQITSKDKANEILTTKVYPVGDLIGTGGMAQWGPIMNMLTSTIQPDTWDDNGGPGSIQPVRAGTQLVISQKYDVHREIADLLVRIRRGAGLPQMGPTGAFATQLSPAPQQNVPQSAPRSANYSQPVSRDILASRLPQQSDREAGAMYATNAQGLQLVGSLYGTQCQVRSSGPTADRWSPQRPRALPIRISSPPQPAPAIVDDPFQSDPEPPADPDDPFGPP